ncbi:transposase [Lactobacillus sp. PV037]|uniref:helix-turn-helix domain-containing protein n=1 Tax=unclassified Lactobacillus TaxID=2620435 RepID=UPI00223F3D4A|nr:MULTISPECIES: helix-turn-helix domain-containing protein [unclassified Lactobacillus]QNQ81608.1 transposase [Lactobacillus sp. PV012]QNQ84345.1 transposase [Lactobacillus sp. PV037]
MSKVSYEQKLSAVKSYLNGESSKKIIDELNIRTNAQLLFWVKQYKAHGASALKEKRNHKGYNKNFKLKVLQWKKDNEATYEATALKFGISSPSIIYQWQRLLNKGELLNSTKKRGRPALEQTPVQSLSSSERTELEQLRKQINALIQENNYLKNLVS